MHGRQPASTLTDGLMRPRSRGVLRLADPDPHSPPDIFLNLGRELAAADAFAAFGTIETAAEYVRCAVSHYVPRGVGTHGGPSAMPMLWLTSTDTCTESNSYVSPTGR
jgi:hypothetical protein